MLARLAKGPATIGELGRPFDMTKGAVTKHIKILERCGLLRRDVDGRVHRCRIDPKPLEDAETWVDQIRTNWEASFDALADYLDELKERT